MHTRKWKKWAKWTLGFLAFLIVFHFSRTAEYLLSEFYFTRHTSINDINNGMQTCNNPKHTVKHIPNQIHQIYAFKSSGLLEEHKKKRERWIEFHSNYTHNLWSETDVKDLISKEYPHLYLLYQSYSNWIQRADVARYVLLYHYGGWYIDLDVTCKHSLHELAEEAYHSKKSVVVHTTFPVGTSNDFFGITPRHPYLKSVLDNLPAANRWFVFPHANIMLTAGSTYFWGRYLNYPCKDDFIMLESERFNRYVQIEHDGSWHSWDDTVIILIVTNSRAFVVVTIIALGILFVVVAHFMVSRRPRRRLLPFSRLRII